MSVLIEQKLPSNLNLDYQIPPVSRRPGEIDRRRRPTSHEKSWIEYFQIS
jgi:hypothetical protein